MTTAEASGSLWQLSEAWRRKRRGNQTLLFRPLTGEEVTLESRDRGYVEQALTELLTRLPDGAVVKVT